MARAVGLGVLAAVLAVAACDDDAFLLRWEMSPDTVVLYSLAQEDLDLHSAFNFNRRVNGVDRASGRGDPMGHRA